MDVCDPGQDMKNIRKLILVHTGKKIKLNRDQVCEIFRSANLGKLPLPPLGITKDKRYLMDAKSQLTQSDYEVLFSSSSVSAEIKRLAKKVGLINVDKSISELKTAIGRRLRGMKVREPVMLSGGVRTIKRVSTTYNNVKTNDVNTPNRNANVSGNTPNRNANASGNTPNRNANASGNTPNRNANVSGNTTNRTSGGETSSTIGIKTEPSVINRNNANRYRKQASNALVRRRRESVLKLVQGATTVNVAKNTNPKRSVFGWLFDGSKKNGNMVKPSNGNKNSAAKLKQLQNSLNKKQRELEQQQANQAKKIQNARNEAERAKAAAVANATNESRRAANEAQKKLEEAEATAKEIVGKMNAVKANAEVNKAAALKQAGENKNAALKQAENNKNAALKQAENNKNAALKEANAAKNKAIEEVKLAEQEAAQAATAEERAEAAEKLKKAQENVTQAELNKTAVIEKANSNMQKAKNLANKKIELSRLAANAGVNISNKINAINANTNINALRTEIQNKKSAANANLKNKRQTQLSNLLNSSNALNNQAKMGFLQRFERGENFNTLMNSARKNIQNKSNANLKNKQQSHLSNLLNSSNVLNNQMKVKYLQNFEKGMNFNTLMNSIRKNIKANSNAKLVNAQQKAANANMLRESLNAAKVNLETEKAASQAKINEATEAARVAERAAANANSANEREKAAKNLQNAQNKLKNVQEQANQTKKNLNQAANNAQAKRVRMMEKLINNSTHLTNTNKIAYTRRFSEGEKIKDLAEEIREKLAANQQKALNNAKTAANSNKQKALNNAQARANANKQKALNNAKVKANANAQNAAQKAANNAKAEAARINGIRRKGEALKNVKETLNRYNNTLGSNTWPREKQNYVNTFNRGNKTKNQIVEELEAKKAQKAANNAEAAKKIQNEANAKKAANNAEAARKAKEEANAEAARKAKKNKNTNELSVLLNSSNVLNNQDKVKYLNSFEKGANFNSLMNTVRSNIKAKTNKRNANAEAAKKAQNEANAKKAANNAEAAKKAQNEANAKKAANNAEAAKKAQNEANAEAAKKAQNEANAEAAKKAKKNKNTNELSVLLNSSNVLNNKDKIKYLNSFEKGANFNTLLNTVKANIKAKTNKRNANAEAANEANATAAMEKLNKNAKLQGNKNRKTLLKLLETTKTNKKESNEYINAFEKGRQTFKEIKEDIVMKAKRNAFGRKLNSKPNETVNNNAEMKASATFNNLNVKPKRNALMEKAKKEVAQIGGRIGKWGNAIKGANTLNKVSNLNKKLNKKSELRNEIKISKLGPINKTGHRVKIMQLENNVGARRRIFEQQLTNLAEKAKKKELSTYISGLAISKANKNGFIKQIGVPNANLNMIRASANKQVLNKTKVIDNPLFENNGEISAAALAPVKNKVGLRLGGRAAEPRPPNAPPPATSAPRSFRGAVKNMQEKKVMNGVRVAAKIAKNQKELSEATGAQRIQLARQQRAAVNRNKGANTTTAASLLTTSSPTKSRQQRRMNEAVAKKAAKQANTKKRLNNQAARAKALKARKRG